MFVAASNESIPSTTTTSSSSSSMQWLQLCHHFEFSEILSATQNFDELLVIGRGGFGRVYKGNIGSTLMVVAIKRLDAMSNQGPSEFWAEVEMLSKLRHCHLVSLIGYCNHEAEMILVYEYMPHGTLEDHLHKFGTSLSWCQRLKICIGAARGLDYLHTGTGIEFGVIHRDVKSSNILLDESWAAKVSDFGLSKISPRNQQSTHVSTLVKGTFGYFDPNYFATGKLTRKSDVYAFGVVLLEVLCRKRAVDDSLDWGLATWAQDSIKEGRLKDIVDSSIKDEIFPKCLKQYVQIAKRCLDNHPKNRPTMAEVVFTLEYALMLQEKANNLLQTSGKTILGKMVDMFTFDGNNSGVEFGFLMPKKRKQLMLREKLEEKLKGGVASIKFFRAQELKLATMNFSEYMIIGRGGYGTVYKGILPDQRVVAIKRATTSDESEIEQFINEIVVFAQTHHRNVVQILGCCLETEVPMLIYEYVSNGTLSQHIHDQTNRGSLSWDSRLRIAYESAGALAFMHSLAPIPIVHRDITSSNILLDENRTAKVADFGVSKSIHLGDDHVTTPIQGTIGYLDPEYFRTSHLTLKSDVYSFGVVLVELLTGLRPIDNGRGVEDRTLASYFVKAHKENRLLEIVDRQLLEEASDEQLEAAGYLSLRCLHLKGVDRPSMKEVSMELERIRNFKKHPKVISQDNTDNE